MEQRTFVGITPLFWFSPSRLDEPLERVVFHNPRTKRVESRICDDDGSSMRSTAQCDVHEVHDLANVHDHGHVDAIGMAETVVPSRAGVENVAVDEGNGRLGADESLEAHDSGIVQAHHHVMAVDELREALVEQNSTVAHYRACPVRLPELHRAVVYHHPAHVVLINAILHQMQQSIHHLRLMPLVLHPSLQ